LVGCSGDKAYLWSYGEQRILKDTYTGHQGLIFTSKFISGIKLATGSADRTIKIWDLYGRQCIYFDYFIYKIISIHILRYTNFICRFKMS
jgi:WD40 repeat protein